VDCEVLTTDVADLTFSNVSYLVNSNKITIYSTGVKGGRTEEASGRKQYWAQALVTY